MLNAWNEMINHIDVGDSLSPHFTDDLDIDYFETKIVDGTKVVKRNKIVNEVTNRERNKTKNNLWRPNSKR